MRFTPQSEAAARLLRMRRMDQDEEDLFLLQQLAPGNIVGVHNYCDGWCERCGFASRCVVYASLARDPMLKADNPLLEHLTDRFDQVRTLVARRSTFSIEEALKKIGELNAADSAAYDREQARRDERRRRDPILREARAYSDLVGAWFEVESNGFRAHADALVRRAEVENVDDISLAELARILDSIEIVRHDCLLIFVKLRRAIDGQEDSGRDGWDEDPVQNDHNGSAKLALTCIDRSEGAWRAIDQWYPPGGGARALAEQLAELRTAVEGRFPRARAFLRPGFDGLVTPD
jgi:hypothetical protein